MTWSRESEEPFSGSRKPSRKSHRKVVDGNLRRIRFACPLNGVGTRWILVTRIRRPLCKISNTHTSIKLDSHRQDDSAMLDSMCFTKHGPSQNRNRSTVGTKKTSIRDSLSLAQVGSLFPSTIRSEGVLGVAVFSSLPVAIIHL